jgi:hypothetical protein
MCRQQPGNNGGDVHPRHVCSHVHAIPVSCKPALHKNYIRPCISSKCASSSLPGRQLLSCSVVLPLPTDQVFDQQSQWQGCSL